MIRIYFIIAVALMLTGCADKVDLFTASTMEPVGFFYGLWHGFIIIWAFIGSLLFDSVAVYATYNNGRMYDFGFVAGILILILGYDNASD